MGNYRILTISVVLMCMVPSRGSIATQRRTRSLSFLPFFGGGDGPESSQNVDSTSIVSSPAIAPNYPIWRVHRYNGIKLSPALLPSQRSVVAPADPYVPSASENVPQETIGDLPVDLRNLAASLGYTDNISDRNLNDITSMLGTGSRQETIDLIRDLAKSTDGVNLIRDFVGSIRPSEDEEEPSADGYESLDDGEESQASSRTLIPPREFPQLSSALDRTYTDLGLLRTVVPNVAPDSGLFDRLTSWLSYLRPIENTPIHYRPSSTDHDRNFGTIPVSNLPPLRQLPPIVGLPNLRLPADLPPIQIPHGHPNRFYQRVGHQLAGPNELRSANKQLARLPLVDRHRTANPINSYGNSLADQYAIDGDIGGAASEQSAVRLELPQPSAIENSSEKSTTSSRIGPRRIAGVQDDEAYATGRIYEADPAALNLPIVIDSQTAGKSARSHNTEIIDEKTLIEDVADLTSRQYGYKHRKNE